MSDTAYPDGFRDGYHTGSANEGQASDPQYAAGFARGSKARAAEERFTARFAGEKGKRDKR